MMESGKLVSLLTLYLTKFVYLVAASPTYTSCGSTQCFVPDKFNWEAGKAYEFHYEGETSTSTTGERATIKMSADVTISVTSPCQMAMKLFNTKMEEVDPRSGREHMVSDYSWSRPLDRLPIRFSYDDGHIGSICSSDSDPNWSVNIKKGILSMFQNTMNRLDVDYFGTEKDIHGQCEVNYQWMVSRSHQLNVKRIKDLSTCDDRSAFVSPIQSTPYPFHKGPQSFSLLNSNQECVQTVDNKKIVQVQCEETHLLRPFSNGEAGANTKVKQKLEFTREEDMQEESADSGRYVENDLRFDHHSGPEGESDNNAKAVRALRDFAESNEVEEVSGNTPILFSKLTSELKKLDYSTLWNLYQNAESKCRRLKNPRVCQRYIEDALVALGSPAAISVMKDLIDQGNTNDAVVASWITSLAFIPRPNVATLEAALPLIRDLSPPPTQAQLTVSAMAQRFCSQHHGDCIDVPAVKQIITVLMEGLNHDCTASGDDPYQLLLTLKSIGNLGQLTPGLFNVLKKCVNNEDISLETRVTALQTFRKMPCSHARSELWWPYRTDNYEETMVGWLLTVYKDQNYDVELRIAAYLQAMNCPDMTVIETVKATLMEEDIQQVGAFVWTHLQNLVKTSLPSKAKIQGLLSTVELQTKYTPDMLKFSSNFEASVFYDQLNMGGGVESNIIFSPGSYLPKTINLNLTADILGESINVLEVGSRLEGYEYYLQRLFGPEGVLKKEGIQTLFSELQDDPGNNFRRRRSTGGSSSTEDTIKEQGRRLIEEFGHEEVYKKDPLASLYMRIFGQEISFNRFIGFEELKKAFRKNFNPLMYLRQFTEGPSNVGYNISRAMQVLDSHCIVPTGLGLPLNLTLEGSAVVTIDSVGTFNIGNPFTDGSIQIEGSVLPTISVQMTGTMQVDGGRSTAGARVVASYHTSTALDGQLHIQGNQRVKFHLNMPKEEQKIVNVQSSVEIFVKDKSVPMEDHSIKKENTQLCTGPILERAMGVKLCSQLTYPNASMSETGPYFPLTGPAKLDLTLRKTDPDFQAYIFEYDGSFDEDKTKVFINFNMPQSKIERSLSFRLVQDSKNIDLSLYLPNNKITLIGKYKNEDMHKLLDITCRHNNDEIFVFMAKLLAKGNRGYKPKLRLSVMEQSLVTLEGDIHVKESEGITYSPILTLTVLEATFDVSGEYTVEDHLTVSNLELAYQLPSSSKTETIRLSYKDNYIQSGSLERTSTDLNLIFSQFPDFNVDLDWEFEIAAGSMETQLEFSHGPNFDNKENKLKIKQIYTQTLNEDQTKVNGSFRITHPVSNIDWYLGSTYASSDELTLLSLRAYTSPTNVADLSLYYQLKDGPTIDVDGGMELELPNKSPIRLQVKLMEVMAQTLFHVVYKMTAKLEWERHKEMQLHSVISTVYGESDEKHSNWDFNITMPSNKVYHLGLEHENKRRKWKLGVEVNGDDFKMSASVSHKLVGTKHLLNAHVAASEAEYTTDIVVDFAEGLALDLHIHMDKERDIKLRYRRTDLPNGIEAEGQLKWDANRDASKQVRGVLLVKDLFRMSPEIRLTLVFPERTIVLNYEGSRIGYRTFGEYNFNNKFSLSWQPDKIITMETKLHKVNSEVMDLDFILTTPFEDMETIKAQYKHNFAADKSDLHLILEKMDRNLVTVNMRSETSSSQGLYMVNIETVTRTLRQMEFKTDYLFREGYFKGMTQWEWNREKIFATDIEGSIKSTKQKFFEFESKATLLLPIEDLEDIELNLECGLTRNYGLEGEATLHLDRDKYTAKLKGTSVFSPDTDMRLDVSMTTPHWGYEEIFTNVRFLLSDRMSLLAETRWPGKAMNLTVMGEAQSFYNFRFLTDFKSPFSSAEVFKIELKNGMKLGDHFKTAAIIQWASDKTVGFESDGEFTSVHKFKLNAKAKTPSKKYRVMGFHLLHDLDFNKMSWTSIAMGEFSGEKVVINIGASGKEGSNYKYEGHITASSINLFPSLSVEAEHRLTNNKYVTGANAQWKNKKYEFSHEYRRGDGWDMDTVIKLKTPLKKFSAFQMRYNLLIEPLDHKEFYAGVAMVRNEETWQISGEAELNTETLMTSWTREGFARLNTPFEMANNCEVAFDIKGNDGPRIEDYSTAISFTYGDKVTDTSSYFKVINGRWYGWIDIRRPIDLIDSARIDAVIEFGGETGLNHVNITTKLATTTVLGDIVGNIYHDYKPGASERTMELEIKWTGLKQIKLHWFRNARQLRIEIDSEALPYMIIFQGDLFTSQSDPALKGSLKWGDNEVVLQGSYVIENYLPVRFTGQLTTPFPGYREARVELHTTDTNNGRTLSAVLESENRKIDVFLGGNYRPGIIEGEIKLETPWESINQLNCWTKLQYESWNDVMWELKLKTPYEKLPQLDTVIEYRQVREGEVRYKFFYETEDQSNTFSGMITRIKNKKYRLKHTNQLSWEMLRFSEFLVDVDVDNSWWKTNTDIKIATSTPELPELTMSGGWDFPDEDKPFRIFFDSSFPFEGLESIVFDLTLKLLLSEENEFEYEGNVLMKLNDKQISLESEAKYDFDLVMTKIKVKTPFKAVTSAEFEVEYSGLRKQTSSLSVAGKLNDKYKLVKLFHIHNLRHIDGTISLELPYAAYKDIEIQYFHNFASDSYEITTKFSWPEDKFVEFLFLHDDLNSRGEVSLSKSESIQIIPLSNAKLTYTYKIADDEIFVEFGTHLMSLLVGWKREMDSENESNHRYIRINNPIWAFGGNFTTLTALNNLRTEYIINLYDLDIPTTKLTLILDMIDTVDEHHTVLLKGLTSQREISMENQYYVKDTSFAYQNILQLNPDHKYLFSIFGEDLSNIREDLYKWRSRLSYPSCQMSLTGKHRVTDRLLHSQATYELQDERVDFHIRVEDVAITDEFSYVGLAKMELPKRDKSVILRGILESKEDLWLHSKLDLEYDKTADSRLVMETILQNVPIRRQNLPGMVRGAPVQPQTQIEGEFKITHPVTKLQLQVEGKFEIRGNEAEISAKSVYVNTQRQRYDADVMARLDSTWNTINVTVTSPTNSFSDRTMFGHLELTRPTFTDEGRWWSPRPLSPLSIKAYRTVGGRPEAELDISVDPNKPTFIFDADYIATNPVDSMGAYMMGGVINPQTFQVKLLHKPQGEDVVTDFDALSHLNHTQLFTTYIHWRPNLIYHIRDGFVYVLTKGGLALIEVSKDSGEWVSREIVEASKDIAEDIEDKVLPSLRPITSEFDNIREDWEVYIERITAMEENNDFYIQEIMTLVYFSYESVKNSTVVQGAVNFVTEKWEEFKEKLETFKNLFVNYDETITVILEWFGKAGEKWLERYEIWVENLSSDATSFFSIIQDFTTSLFVKFRSFFSHYILTSIHEAQRAIKEVISLLSNRVYNFVKPYLYQMYDYIERKAAALVTELKEFFYSQRQNVLGQEYNRFFGPLIEDIDAIYRDFSTGNLKDNIIKYIAKGYDFLAEKYEVLKKIGDACRIAYEFMVGAYYELLDHPTISAYVDPINRVYNQLVWIIEYTETHERIKSFFTAIWEDRGNMVLKTGQMAHLDSLKHKSYFKFKPDEGYLIYEQKLPFKWRAFTEQPSFSSSSFWDKLYNLYDEMIRKKKITETITIYYTADYMTWVPPFEGHAALSGLQHYRTWDGQMLQFKSPGRFLLGGDMVTGNFFFVVSNEEVNSQTVRVIYIVVHDDVVAIYPDSQVKVNGQSVVLPHAMESGGVIRIGTKITVTSESQGFTVECNSATDMCTFDISGWHTGKTAGLLGTYDFETSTDFFTKSREYKPLSEWAFSWVLPQGSPVPQENQAIYNARNDTQKDQKCTDLFQSKFSQFEMCFERVPPEPFLQMCRNDLAAGKNPCTTSHFYVRTCKVKGKPVKAPTYCTTCTIQQTELKESESRQLKEKEIESSSDVVFLIENKECNSNLMNRNALKKLVASLNTELDSNGIRNNRFAMIGFGGDGVYEKPYVFSKDNKLFFRQIDFVNALQDIPIGNGKTDIYSTLMFASKLPYRPTVSKTFILLLCTECSIGEPYSSGYGDIYHMLIDNLVTMHLMMPIDFDAGKKRYRNKIYGVDKNFAFKKQSSLENELEGDRGLRSKIKKDSLVGECGGLAEETEGTLFSSKFLFKRTKQVKRFIEVLAKRITETATPAPCQDCECFTDYTKDGNFQCRACEQATDYINLYDFFGPEFFGEMPEDTVADIDMSDYYYDIPEDMFNSEYS